MAVPPRPRRRLATCAAAALLVGPVATPAPASAVGAGCADVFPRAVVASLARDFPGQRVTAHVHDLRTGCQHSLHDGLRLTTASVVKAGVLGAVLLRAQDAGRGLTDWERARIEPMVTLSHNNPHVSDLYAAVGGVAGMDRADRRWGLTATTNRAAYGATSTTARDRTRLARLLLHGGGPLGPAGRAEAWRSLTRVHPTQRWGISAGVPAGSVVALKNGFYPMTGAGWRVGSTGVVRLHDGGGYAVTVLTDRAASHEQGQRLVEAVSRRVAAVLTRGRPAPRSVERSVCTTTSRGETWTAVARRVGSSPAAVRRVSGGNPVPLHGQRACSPDLRAAS